MKRLIAFLVAMLAAAPAAAYMGPGAGLGMLGSLAAVIGAVLVALVAIVWMPIRILLKRRRKEGAGKGA
jgi:hypothetical protein